MRVDVPSASSLYCWRHRRRGLYRWRLRQRICCGVGAPARPGGGLFRGIFYRLVVMYMEKIISCIIF